MYASTGEKLDEIERFHPDRMAGRILGMGDVMSLIEKAQDEFSEDQAADLERKIRKQQFTLEDFLAQMQQVRSMGPLGNMLGMIPGMGKAMKGMGGGRRARAGPHRGDHQVDDPRRARPPRGDQRLTPQADRTGSGTTVQAVNHLVKQFGQMRKLMKSMADGKMPDPAALLGGGARRAGR